MFGYLILLDKLSFDNLLKNMDIEAYLKRLQEISSRSAK